LLELGGDNEKPIACLDDARAMFDGDEEIVQQLLAVFFRDVDRTLGDLRRAAAGRDFARLREVAHSIKGSVGLFGAARATDAALRLEVLVRDASPAALGIGCESLEAEMKRLANALRGSLAAR
jgi:protein-histidine pros-kinase